MRLLSLLVILLACTFALPDGAEARPRRPGHGKRVKKKRRRVRRGRRDKLPNMPRGWAWPPTPAMKEDGARCIARLGELGVAHRVIAETIPKITTPVEVPGREIGGVRFESTKAGGAPLVMDCRFAEAMAFVGAPILRTLGVRTLRYSTLYDPRGVILRGHERNIISRHALGLALDVYEFVTDAGAAQVVLRDYSKSALLRDIEKHFDDSDAYRRVLTPGKDRRSHKDHFHFEARTLGDPGGTGKEAGASEEDEDDEDDDEADAPSQ